MADHLPLPPELWHLMEKRSEPERRKRGRRAGSRRQVDLGPLGTLESTGELDQVVLEERRVTAERRKVPNRRRRNRRKDQRRG
jgi:hypothetical protein